MRKIKFRMWNPISKIMIDLQAITPLALNMNTDGLFIPFCGMPLMQFTGLCDKQRKEIYEGDIVKQFPGFGCEWEDRIGTINYQGASFWFNFGCQSIPLDDHDCDFEIRGNIYENPEIIIEEE